MHELIAKTSSPPKPIVRVRITSSIRCQCYFQSTNLLLLLIINYCRYGSSCQTIHVGSDISFIYQAWKDSGNSYNAQHE